MSDYDMIVTLALASASALATYFAINENSKYKKAKKVLKTAEVNELMSPSAAIELVKTTKQKQDCYVCGKVKSLDAEKKIYSGTFADYIYPQFKRVIALPRKQTSTSSKFLIEDNCVSIPAATYQDTIALGCEFKGQQGGPVKSFLKYGAIILATGFSFPIRFFDVNCSISEGEYITAFGTVKYNLRTGDVEIAKVRGLLKGSKKDLIGYLGKEVNLKWFTSGVAKVIAFGLLAGCSYSVYRLFKKWRERPPRQAEADGQKVLAVDSLLCVKCKTNYRAVVYNDCDHLAVCTRCDDQLKLTKCPICKKDIKGRSQIYLS